jgi:hypothetical protein
VRGREEELVARGMAPPLVDRVQGGQVHHDHGDLAVDAMGQPLLQLIDEEAARRQPGQRVVEDLPQQAVADPIGALAVDGVRQGLHARCLACVGTAAVLLELLEREDLGSDQAWGGHAEALEGDAPMSDGHVQGLAFTARVQLELEGVAVRAVKADGAQVRYGR